MLPSYPNEFYSVDNCAIAASITLFHKAINTNILNFTQPWLENFRKVCLETNSGTLVQAFDANGNIIDDARASGTFLGIFLLSFMDRQLSRELYENAKKEYFTKILGYGAVKEYRQGSKARNGDIDSGPVIFNLGVSPVGFMLGNAKIFEDHNTFTTLFATCWLGGAPQNGSQWNWKTAGPVGDAILFSMLTGINNKDWEKYEAQN